MNTSWAAAPVFLGLLLTGCASPQMTRIREQRALYESWPIETRQAVLNGRIERGMNPDMVRMALGQSAMNREDGGLLAWMGAGGKPDRTSRQQSRQMSDHAGIGGRGR